MEQLQWPRIAGGRLLISGRLRRQVLAAHGPLRGGNVAARVGHKVDTRLACCRRLLADGVERGTDATSRCLPPFVPPRSVRSFCSTAARMGLVIVEFCGLFAKDSEYMGVVPFVPDLWAPTPRFLAYSAHKNRCRKQFPG
jgi:hypothetical protein